MQVGVDEVFRPEAVCFGHSETRVSDQLPDLPIDQMADQLPDLLIDQMAGEGAGPGVPRCVVKVHCENLAEVSLQAF